MCEKPTKVTRKTMKKRAEPIEEPNDGTNLTRTFDKVSPTTTLYEIIAVEIKSSKNGQIEIFIIN